MEERDPTFPQMDTFATTASWFGAVVMFFGSAVAVNAADHAGSWDAVTFSLLLGGIGFGLLIMLAAQALHVP